MKKLRIWQIPEQQLNINEEINDKKCVKAIFQQIGTKRKFVISLYNPNVIFVKLELEKPQFGMGWCLAG